MAMFLMKTRVALRVTACPRDVRSYSESRHLQRTGRCPLYS